MRDPPSRVIVKIRIVFIRRQLEVTAGHMAGTRHVSPARVGPAAGISLCPGSQAALPPCFLTSSTAAGIRFLVFSEKWCPHSAHLFTVPPAADTLSVSVLGARARGDTCRGGTCPASRQWPGPGWCRVPSSGPARPRWPPRPLAR